MSYFIHNLQKYTEVRTNEDKEKYLNDPNYVLTCKKDGCSYILAKDLDGEIHLYSGTISKKDGLPIDKIDNCPHLRELANNFPNGTSIVGEICSYWDFTANKECEHTASKRVTSIMGAKSKLAINRQREHGPVEYYLFDVIFYNNEDYYKKPFIERHQKLEEIYENNKQYPWLTITKLYSDHKEEILTEWFNEGCEGGVLQDINAEYTCREIGLPSLRRKSGIKIKTVSTYDVVILGVTMPDKEYNGKYAEDYEYRDEEGNPVNRLWALGYANAFIIGIRDGDKECPIGTVASGLTDEIRKAAGEDPDSFYGKVIEVRCMSCDNEAHTLRHPVFLRFRDDKTAEECTWDTIFK